MDASANGRAFLDSNVLVYAFDSRVTHKQAKAITLLEESSSSTVAISTQVLSEFYWTVTRKLPLPLSRLEARSVLNRLSRLIVVTVDRELIESAIELEGSASIAYWDALIVKAASSVGCRRLLTEDLNHGQVIDGVLVENPFISG